METKILYFITALLTIWVAGLLELAASYKRKLTALEEDCEAEMFSEKHRLYDLGYGRASQGKPHTEF